MSPADIEELYVAHARRIAGYLMRATGDADAAPATWLYAIAANKLRDWRRRDFAEDRARRRAPAADTR